MCYSRIFTTSINLPIVRIIDSDNDFLPDEINSQIIINSKCSDNEFISACNISTTLGLNSLGCNIPIAFLENDYNMNSNKVKIFIGNSIEKVNTFKSEGNINFDKESNSLYIYDEDNKIQATSEFFCTNYNYLIKPDEVSLKDFKENFKSMLYPSSKPKRKVIFNKEYNFLWEVDDVKEIIKKKVLDKINKDDDVEIKIVVS